MDKHIVFLDSPEYRKEHTPTQQIALATRHRAYCLAKKAAAAENWEGVHDALLEAWAVSEVPMDTADIDLVILAYRFYQQHPDLAWGFKGKVEPALRQMWQALVNEYNHMQKPPFTYNSAAWFLANTNGDYSSALTFAEAALNPMPDDVHFLDTLAHVYFLGEKWDEAIRTQEQVVRLAPEAIIFQKALERFKQAKKGVSEN